MSTKKPTLLVLASTFSRWQNDTEPRFVYDLSKRLLDNFEIIVLTPHCTGAKEFEIFDGLKVFRYRYAPQRLENLAYEGGITNHLKRNKFNWLLLPFFFAGQFLAIRKLLSKYPIDVIHAHWLIPQGILALMARMLGKNKPSILCTSHGGDLYGLNDVMSRAIKRYVIRRVEALTVVSSGMKEEVKYLVPTAKEPVVAPMGTDLLNLFTPDDSVIRKPNQLLFVGRLVEKKGLKHLLLAMSGIIKTNTDVVLNIAGSGPEITNLEFQVRELGLAKHVNFLGRLSHEELVAQYRESALAIFPFVQAKGGDVEGLGLVMIEAMGCGCPVIASDIAAVKDVIIDNQTGVLVRSADPKSIEEKVVDLLASPNFSRELAQSARQNVLQRFGWESQAKQYGSLLSKITTSGNVLG